MRGMGARPEMNSTHRIPSEGPIVLEDLEGPDVFLDSRGSDGSMRRGPMVCRGF